MCGAVNRFRRNAVDFRAAAQQQDAEKQRHRKHSERAARQKIASRARDAKPQRNVIAPVENVAAKPRPDQQRRINQRGEKKFDAGRVHVGRWHSGRDARRIRHRQADDPQHQKTQRDAAADENQQAKQRMKARSRHGWMERTREYSHRVVNRGKLKSEACTPFPIGFWRVEVSMEPFEFQNRNFSHPIWKRTQAPLFK